MTFFFIPLWITYTVTMLTHLIMNAGLARTPFPELAIAAYSIGVSVVHLFESPALVMLPASLAMARGEREFRVLVRIAYLVLGSVTLLMAALAFTPLGRWLFATVMGVPDHLVDPSLDVLRLGVLVPMLSGMRQLYNGAIIHRRETFVLTVAIFLRLLVILLVIAVLLRVGWLVGGTLGIAAFISGVFTEFVVAVFWVRRRRRVWRRRDWTMGRLQRGQPAGEPAQGEAASERPAARPRRRGALQPQDVLRFVLPFLVAAVAEALFKPALNAGLARAEDSQRAIAAFAVAWTVAYMVLNPVRNLHQVVMVFYPMPQGPEWVRRFCRMGGALGAAFILLLAFTPLGRWVMGWVVGADSGLGREVLSVVPVFALQAVVAGWEQFYTGRFLLERQTKVVSSARSLNLLVLTISSFLLLLWRPGLGAVTGAWAMVLGNAAELGFLSWRSRSLEGTGASPPGLPSPVAARG